MKPAVESRKGGARQSLSQQPSAVAQKRMEHETPCILMQSRLDLHSNVPRPPMIKTDGFPSVLAILRSERGFRQVALFRSAGEFVIWFAGRF